MRWSQATEVGWVRHVNEDSICVCPDIGFFAVADGMGGHQAGEVASRLALQELKNFLYTYANNNNTDIESALRQGIRKANKMVYRSSFRNDDFQGMGTTLSCVVIKYNQLYLAHVGDSRVYLLQQNKIIQLTEDHSMVQKMLKNGIITKNEAMEHPYRHMLTRALGVESDMEVDIARLTVCSGDVILLCTDGLSGYLKEEEIYNIIYSSTNLDQTVNHLVHSALTRGSADNISVILVAVD